VVLVAFTRPYEGMLLCLPVLAVLGRWVFLTGRQGSNAGLVKLAAGPLALLIAAGAWLSYYDYRAFGSPTTLPYTIDRATYAIAPYFVWQGARPEPDYRHPHIKAFYESELEDYRETRTLQGEVVEHVKLGAILVHFYGGFALLPLLVLVPRAARDRRIRYLSISLLVLFFGMSIQIFAIPHYVAPFTAAMYALGLQSARHLNQWRLGDQSIGQAIVRMCILVCLIMAGIRPFDRILHIPAIRWPSVETLTEWYGPDHFGTAREAIERRLEQVPGRQLALVCYPPDWPELIEWVYNSADINSQQVIWARDMGPRQNRELIDYYKDRKVWLVRADDPKPSLMPYPTLRCPPPPAMQAKGSSHP
ncbi:MAG: hypothetical protein WCA37_01205, partial [Terracidiphilus sp.]